MVFKDGKRMSAAEDIRTEPEELQQEARHFQNHFSNLEVEIDAYKRVTILGPDSNGAWRAKGYRGDTEAKLA